MFLKKKILKIYIWCVEKIAVSERECMVMCVCEKLRRFSNVTQSEDEEEEREKSAASSKTSSHIHSNIYVCSMQRNSTEPFRQF